VVHIALFSEFVFDLQETLPPALADVPHAADPARPLIENLCERLRNNRRTRGSYVEPARYRVATRSAKLSANP